jgi:ribosomal protein L20
LFYFCFMNLLTGAGIAVNRKVLAEMAVRHPEAFSRLVESVRKTAA